MLTRPADGYTVMALTQTHLYTMARGKSNMKIDDIIGVARAMDDPTFITVSGKSKYKTLKDFYDFFGGDREISISKEITKIFESTNRGKIIDLIGYYKDKKLKGEFVIVVKGLK